MVQIGNCKTLAPKRILVVDDEPLVLNSLRMVLTFGGHQVETARNGVEALAMFERGKYDLVITDFGMPGMDGLALAGAIKARSPGHPILMITAHAEAIAGNGEKHSRIDLLLAKPFSVEQLEEALARVFSAV
jgi:CheY-like chemotaxis protein